MNTRSEVVKRDGSIVPYQPEKVQKALESAFISTGIDPGTTEIYLILEEINKLFETCSSIPVEVIQDTIEYWLMKLGWFNTAKAFILYREKHKEARFIKERIEYIENYVNSGSNAATSSETDGNSNVSIKNVANLEGEVYKTTNRIIQRQRMKDKLNELFPEVAKKYEEDLNHHIIYTHDEASTPVLKNYCMAVSMYPLLENGTSTMDGLSTTAPKNLDSFCGQFINLVFLLSSQCKGAVGFGEFFNFFEYFCVKEWGEDFHLRESEVIDTKGRTIKDRIHQSFQNIVYSINQCAGNRSYQSPFTNFNYFDSNYWHSLFDNFCFPDGTHPKWERVSYLQKLFMKWFNKERTKTLLTYPVESMCLLHDGNDVIDKEYKDFTTEMWAEGHSFFVYLSDNPDAVASCCRLRNEVVNNTFSSTTGLTGVQTGSVNVITLNLNRIIQDWYKLDEPQEGVMYDIQGVMHDEKDRLNSMWIGSKLMAYDSLKHYLVNILKRVYKYHIAYKTMLYEVEKKGMLSSSKAGYIRMKKLFSTIGVNGFNEAAEFLGLKVSNNKEYKEFITYIFNIIKEQNQKHSTPEFLFNLEVVPAESLGSKNYNWDKEENYWVPNDRVLYNSYIYNAHDNTSILDKFILQGGEIAKACSGGQAVHANLFEHLSKEQYNKLINFAIKQGTNYFTFNIPNSQCECGYITKYPITKCPKCNSENITHWTRTIGYLRPISAMDKYRQIEANMRTYNKDV